MLDSDFWWDLAEKFRAIDPRWQLHAKWHQVIKVGEQLPPTTEWLWIGADPELRSIQLEFTALATRGGPKIYPRMDALTGWLEAVRQYESSPKSFEAEVDTDPTTGAVIARHYRGVVPDARQGSINLCKRYEALALETERMALLHEQQENDPQNRPPLFHEWEAFKAIKQTITGPHEEIPEGILRSILGRRYNVPPEHVTLEQIRFEVASLVPYYPAISVIPSNPAPSDPAATKTERKALSDAYFDGFPEKVLVLDMCWAAKQRYREWMRWLGGTLKAGSKPDRAFRAVLTSGKRPKEYRLGEARPKGWK